MSRLDRLKCSLMALLALCTMAVSSASAQEKKVFGYEYNPAQDQLTHYEADEPYVGKPEPLVVKDAFSYLQPWNGRCIESKLPPEAVSKLPCQTSNIKPTLKYHGVQVMGNKWMRMACDEAFKSVQNGGATF